MENKEELREILKSIFSKQLKKCENSLKFFKKVESTVSVNEEWKMKEEALILCSDYDFKTPIQKKSVTLRLIIKTLNEYLIAIDNFTYDELAAFVLGLSINWIDVKYWGIDHLNEKILSLMRAYNYFESIEKKTPEESIWNIKKQDFVNFGPGLIIRDQKLPTQLYDELIKLHKSMLHVLANRSF